jgi:hypothetical protein
MPRRTSSRLSARRQLPDQAELQQLVLPLPAELPQVVLPQPAELPQVVLPQPAELPQVVLPQPAELPQVVLPQPAEFSRSTELFRHQNNQPRPSSSDMFVNDLFRNRRQNEDTQEKMLEMLMAINDSLNRPKSNKSILNQNTSTNRSINQENNQSYSIRNFLFQLFKKAIGFILNKKLSIGSHVMVKRSTGDIVKAQITNIYDNEIQVFYYVDEINKIREKIVKKDEIMFTNTYVFFKFGLLILFVIFLVWIMFFKYQSKNSNYNLLNFNFFNF